jgi:hypothetical protein
MQKLPKILRAITHMSKCYEAAKTVIALQTDLIECYQNGNSTPYHVQEINERIQVAKAELEGWEKAEVKE